MSIYIQQYVFVEKKMIVLVMGYLLCRIKKQIHTTQM